MGQNSNLRRQAGVDADIFTDFVVGQRVMTCDGLPGVVTAVLQGPYPQTEAYEVTLDNGMGGGQYATRDLSSLGATIASGQPYTPTAVEVAGMGNGHLASEDYPELAEILVQRPPLARTEPLAMFAHLATRDSEDSGKDDFPFEDDPDDDPGEDDSGDDEPDADDYHEAHPSRTAAIPLRCGKCGQTYFTDGEKHDCEGKTAGFWNAVDSATGYFDKTHPDAANGDVWSYDWCRFRRDRHCWYPKDLNMAASQQTGYAVWNPIDRGQCWRDKWEEQKACTVAAPGPHSGDRDALTDATISWEQGGQRNGVVVGHLQVEASFEFAAAWTDVRAKAKRIRTTGGVNVLSVTGSKDSGRTVAARVQGDHGVYDTSIASAPGTYGVAYWDCSCPWATYSWGRSGRWKKYEGRMCAHALALSYEVQARGMNGKDVTEDASSPAWAVAASLRPVDTDSWLAPSPASRMAAEMLSQGFAHTAVLGRFGDAVVKQALTMNFKEKMQALVRGVLHKVKEVYTETATALLDNGQEVPVSDLVYPTWDPLAGLAHTGALDLSDSLEGDEITPWEASAGDDPTGAPQDFGVLVDPTEPGAVATLHDEPEPALPATDGKTASLPDASTRDWLMQGSASRDNEQIAAMAMATLNKQAVKTFSPSEQAEIINEGEGVTAANLDRLQLEGTHYEGLDEQDDDCWVD